MHGLRDAFLADVNVIAELVSAGGVNDGEGDRDVSVTERQSPGGA